MSDQPSPNPDSGDDWHELPLDAWRDTYTTLHKWIQIVGKVRQALTPPIDHWWHVTFYLTSDGLTTSPIPYPRGLRTFEIDLNFIEHCLDIRTSSGEARTIPLRPQSVAAFYHEFVSALHALGVEVEITREPDEPPDAIPFDADHTNAAYDAAYAHRWWQIMRLSDIVLKEFRSRFRGKASPVHFFWHSFDLTATRFSGRREQRQPDTERAERHFDADEEFGVGFWPGSGAVQAPAYYAYVSPQPSGFPDATVKPAEAFYCQPFGEFILLYEDVRRSADPKQMLLDFFQSTYEAAARLGHWDRETLEQPSEE